MLRTSALLLAFTATLMLAPMELEAQVCPNPTDTFWKNDTLPQIPGAGSLAVSIIQGLCENEAAAQVFYMPSGMGPQKITKVAVPFGHIFGTGGLTALVNIQIYDGITWNGNSPTLGPKVFDLAVVAGTSMQVFTHGINELDFTIYNVIVGNHPSKAFVVAAFMDFNQNGTCAGGYQADFFTDFAGGSGCTTIPHTSLIYILGQGWTDGKYATVSGFPLCGGLINYFNGNWVIRACTQDAGPPPTCQPSLGFGGPGDLKLEVCGQPLSSGNTADFEMTNATPNSQALLFLSLSFSPTFVPELFGIVCPLPPTIIVGLPANGNGELKLPGAVPGGKGPFSIYLQAFGPDVTAPAGWEASDCLRLDFLP